MENNTVLVLADPTDPTLAMLEELPAETTIAAGNSVEAFTRAAADATVILTWSISGELLRQVFAITPRVRWIHSRSAGLDSVLFPALQASPVTLTNGRGVFSNSLGEFVIGGALFFAKDFRRMIRSQAAGIWDQFDVEPLEGQTLAIVGYGDIGRAIAARARAMGMKVLALRRRPAESAGDSLVDEVFPPERKLEMLARADYIVASAPLTPETRGMIGEAEFAVMKPTAVVMNVGRGPVIDEAALVGALSARRIKGAALDVFDREPLPEGHPFYALDNVLLSPHCVDHTPDWLPQAMRFFLQNFERFRKGEPLINVVDKQRGY
nr:D-isomer specific 2-hydroxyacid dehydrogenase, NAD binding domain protein [uncultured bacterium]